MSEQLREEPWKKFEKDTELLFRAAGYDTERNVEIGGFEFDLIATREEFAGMLIRIAVECKHRSLGVVTNTDTHSFLAAFDALRDRARLTHGIIVTNDRFSRQAHEAINQHPQIKLLNQSNLEDELLGAQAYLHGTAKNYRSQIGSRFIDLSADLQATTGERTLLPQVVQYLTARIDQSDELFTLILGDFGSGKTTVAEQIHRRYSELYLGGKGDIYPFIFYLRTLAQFDSERAFVAAQTQVSRAVSSELFERIQRKGKVLLILDGFDEVATQATVDERMTLFSRIMRISQLCSHLILTSRPSYFTNLKEVNELIKDLVARDSSTPLRLRKKTRRDDEIRNRALTRTSTAVRRSANDGYRLFPSEATSFLYLRPFTPENIIDYLTPFADKIRRKHRKSVPEAYKALSDVYDLTDLMTRPLLLEMFVDVLINGSIRLNDPDLEIGPASLYQIYVNSHLDRDWKVRQFLRREERLTFARAAAIAMLEKGGSLEASYSSIESVVARGMKGVNDWRRKELKGQMDRVVNDVRVCAFMNVTQTDRIEFAHKSFMEYFVSEVIISKMSSNEPIPELEAALNYEILYFVGSHCLIRSENRINMLNHIRHVAFHISADYQSRIKLALIYSERESKERSFVDISFEAFKVRKRTFSECKFERISFRRVVLEEVVFSGCGFHDVDLSGELDRVIIDASSGAIGLAGVMRDLSLRNTERLHLLSIGEKLLFQKGTWHNSDVLLSGRKIGFDTVKLDNVRMNLVSVDHLELSNAALDDCTLRCDYGSVQRPRRPVGITLNAGCRLRRVLLEGILISPSTYLQNEHAFDGCYGYMVVEDESRSVYSFTRKSSGDGARIYAGWSIVGRVVFISSHLAHREKALASLVRQHGSAGLTEDKLVAWAREKPVK